MPTFWSEVDGPPHGGRFRRAGFVLLAATVHAAVGATLIAVLANDRPPASFPRPTPEPPHVAAMVLLTPPEQDPFVRERPNPEVRRAERSPTPRVIVGDGGGAGTRLPLRWPAAVGSAGDTGGAVADGSGRIGLSYEHGHLWIPPLPFSPDEIAERLGLSHTQKVDSAVKAIVEAYLDSLAVDSTLEPVRPPSWVADIGGLDFGVDPQWIYIAGLKIPTLILGLLPLPAGDFDRAKREQQLMEMRRDIYYSAWRAQTLEEFKANVRKLRERKERERELRRAQRIPPGLSPSDSVAGGEDSTP